MGTNSMVRPMVHRRSLSDIDLPIKANMIFEDLKHSLPRNLYP